MGEVTVLLDTHIFLWWLFDDPKLPVEIRDTISNPANTILVSSASVWEISTKYRLGKLPEAAQVAKNVPVWIEKAGFHPLVITPEHAQLSGEWNLAHRDPFDRMLAAQAKLEKVCLASIDKELEKFPIRIMKT
ncbi:MAG: type II toxin-antitoxin system VapC family toxin [Desulfuromusa sp.]|nr:type II toxin-antitoxin system VapC family toxin [Desulfuromusa sp.]